MPLIKCPFCNRIDPTGPGFKLFRDVICSCGKTFQVTDHVYPTAEIMFGNKSTAIQKSPMKLNDILKRSFKCPGSKTLKLELTPDIQPVNAVSDAMEYLNHESNTEHTRIEFKYGRNYIVVAKLKEQN